MEISQETIDSVIATVVSYGLDILFAIIIFFVGKWISGFIRNTVRKNMERRKVDATLIGFLSSLLYYLLMTAVIISAISQLGVKTTSFVAVLGAAGLAVGLALQGSLSNFASGVLLILFRPFKQGDFVEAGGVTGIVDEIGILVTEMHTPDNKAVIVPNSQVMGGHIINFTAKDKRRMDLVFGISYDDDFEKAKGLVMDVIRADERILTDPEPVVRILEHADSSINLAVRPWVPVDLYWDIYFDMMEKVKATFDANGITIPYPQRDVHLFNAKQD